MKLPRQLEAENILADVQAVLEKESVELCSGSDVLIPVLQLNPRVRNHLFAAKAQGELIIGYEAVERALANELHGLQKVNNQSDRISRLVIVSNDGSPRFYRQLEFLHAKQGERVLICRLDIDSSLLGDVLQLKGKKVKAILLNRKKSVVNVLKSLV
ncbi:MAG: hypothetical protein GQ542_07165 [Desulforhopalus sp.]|nr:hypothetical protein [Desulforhopalus sp.]